MNIFKDTSYIDKSKIIMKHKIPLELFKEIKTFVKNASKKRKSKYSFLLDHLNGGKNDYQISVDTDLFEKSFMFGYLIKLGEHYANLQPEARRIRIRRLNNHFDNYDLWINFTEKNSVNPEHMHPGCLSGVIYYTDCFNYPTKFSNDTKYWGKSKEILNFPSTLGHQVEKYKNKKTRITLSFNLEIL